MEKRYIIIRESMWQSIIADTYTYLGLAFVLGLNHFKLDDSTFGAIVLGFMLLVIISVKGSKNTITITGEKEAREYLSNLIAQSYDKKENNN